MKVFVHPVNVRVYCRCEIMQHVTRRNVYSYSKFNPPTFKPCLAAHVLFWPVGPKSPYTAVWTRGGVVGTTHSACPSLGQHVVELSQNSQNHCKSQ